jgi:hypothetical protein
VDRRTVDLSNFPDPIVIYWGMECERWPGWGDSGGRIFCAIQAARASGTKPASCVRGGMEAINDGVNIPRGFLAFTPTVFAGGAMFSARKRLRLQGEESE